MFPFYQKEASKSNKKTSAIAGIAGRPKSTSVHEDEYIIEQVFRILVLHYFSITESNEEK